MIAWLGCYMKKMSENHNVYAYTDILNSNRQLLLYSFGVYKTYTTIKWFFFTSTVKPV